MSWTMSASGHTDTKDGEAAVIDTLRTAAKQANANTASVSTQHHGVVDLLAEPEPQAAAESR